MVHAATSTPPTRSSPCTTRASSTAVARRAHRLWIVPREAITELDDPDLLKPPFDRSHKKPGGYIIKHKLEAAKAARRRRGDRVTRRRRRSTSPAATRSPSCC